MSDLPTESILGYPVCTHGVTESVATIVDWIAAGERRRVFVCANPHSLVTADGDQEFRQALHAADLVTPDGAGIVLASRLLGGTIRERVTGSDIFLELSIHFNKHQPDQRSYFFLGASDATLQTIREKLANDYPHIRFAGGYSPPFKPEFSVEDDERMITTINAAKPDVLWVGMTAPKQEKWIMRNRDRLEVGFIGAIGAVFDFYAGNVKRSHPVFQRLGLEWLPRLLQEPRRLWHRNVVSTPVFLAKVLAQRCGLRVS
jgi:N-acetylglucosaminyldiphosphoundecaprenol N-acetyl-beta-D-mannosaminyltransferase